MMVIHRLKLRIGVVMLNTLKGFIGELKLRFFMYLLLGSKYKTLTNITIKLPDNKTSQIDHIVVSPYGIFVVETKNYKGVITPNEYTGYWTQGFTRKKYKFYSPIKQNNGHISSLKYLLKNKQYPFINIVSFVGKATFKTASLPAGVAIGIWGTIRLIKRHRDKVISIAEVEEITALIEKRRMPNNRHTNKLHIKNVKAKQSQSR